MRAGDDDQGSEGARSAYRALSAGARHLAAVPKAVTVVGSPAGRDRVRLRWLPGLPADPRLLDDPGRAAADGPGRADAAPALAQVAGACSAALDAVSPAPRHIGGRGGGPGRDRPKTRPIMSVVFAPTRDMPQFTPL